MKMKGNPTQKRRKRRKVICRLRVANRPIEQILFAAIVALTTFANQICDIQSTPIQTSSSSSSSSSSSNDLSDNNQAFAAAAGANTGKILAGPQDTVAILGQTADLTCIIEGQQAESTVWARNGMAVARGPLVIAPFHRRYTLPGIATPPDRLAPTTTTVNFTLHILRTSLVDDQTQFICQTHQDRSRQAKLTIWQPPSSVSIVAKIDDSPNDNDNDNNSDNNDRHHRQPASGSNDLLLASVVPEKQLNGAGQPDTEQIMRILVRQSTRLRLECRSDASKPEPKLVWFDGQNRPVQESFNLSNGGQRDNTPDDSDPDNQSVSATASEQDKKQQLIEASTSVLSFDVDRHKHDNQIYTCKADHPAFNDARQFAHLLHRQPLQRVRLEVQYGPEIELTKDRVQVHEHQPLRFHCKAQAKPNLLTYRWYIDDKPIDNATEPELQIHRVTRQMNQRELRCQVSNDVGVNSAVMRLSVHYSPAFVTHLLPASLQPQVHQVHHNHPFGSTHASAGSWQELVLGEGMAPPISRHDVVLARQLAIGVDQNQEVELRCDFDGHPRVSSLQWYHLPTEYSIMGNVTPADSEELIQQGALYATFKYIHRVPVSFGNANANGNDNDDDNELGAVREVDFEHMNAEELREMASFEAAGANLSQARYEPLVGQQPTPTNTLIYEPLEWSLSQAMPVGSSSVAASEHRGDQVEPITTINLHTRSFSSDEVAESPVHPNRDSAGPLNWRTAEVMSSKLQLRQFNSDSVGKYVCLAKLHPATAGGGDPAKSAPPTYRVARSLYLVLRDKPRIISHPQQAARLDQQQIMVECLAQISAVVDNSTQIQWFKEGKLIGETTSRGGNTVAGSSSSESGKNISIIVERSPDLLFIRSRLVIRAPTYGDFGIYNCTIGNSQGRADTMAINLQPTATTGLVLRAIAAIGILSIVVLGAAITCLLAFAPQRRKLASKLAAADHHHQHHHQAKVDTDSKPIGGGGGGSDNLDSGANTATTSSSSTHGSEDSDSLRKSQASSDQPTTLSEAPALDDPRAHLYPAVGGSTDGAHLLQQQQAYHYMQLNSQNHLNHYNHQQQRQMSQMVYHQRLPPVSTTNGWSSAVEDNTTAHYQMPSSVVSAPSQPPPLPPPPQLGSAAMMVESPYVSNGRTYYTSSASSGLVQTGSGHYATTAPASSTNHASHVMLATDGEAQFESQYGSMISNAYRALGYSTTSSPSSGGSSSSSSMPANPVLTIGGQQHLHQHHSSGSASSSPNSMTTYHNLQSGGYISALSLQRDHHTPPSSSSDILLMKATSDSKQTIRETTAAQNYATTTATDINHQTLTKTNTTTTNATTSNSNNNGNGLATHV